MAGTLEKLINKESEVIVMETPILAPVDLKNEVVVSSEAEDCVLNGRRQIAKILDGVDDRLIVIMGPCSVDNYDAAMEYACKLKDLSCEVEDKMLLIMRTYFEKPRTTVGWEGFVYDPDMDGSYDVEKGLKIARKLLIDINELGVPVATEFLNPYVHNYISDLISWGAIGARTCEAQINREFVSGLNMPVGFKNNTSGDVECAVNSVVSSSKPHSYFGMNEEGKAVVIQTKGNKYAHVILRGGSDGSNYDASSVGKVVELLNNVGVSNKLVVDCSHGNSGKDYSKQGKILKEVLGLRGGLQPARQIIPQSSTHPSTLNEGDDLTYHPPVVGTTLKLAPSFNGSDNLTNFPSVVGVMLESYLKEGSGDEYGQSKTDGCVGWKESEMLIKEVYASL